MTEPVSPIKCLLILLDGVADRAHAQLGHQTPLQAAHTPNLDQLAALGVNGLYHAARPGISLPSEAAHFFMMGYGADEFPGRGYLEALGEGIFFRPDDVLLLVHLAATRLDGNGLLVVERKPKLQEEAIELIRAISPFDCEDGQVCFEQTRGPSGILRLRGAISPFVTDSDPMMEGQPLLEVAPWIEHGGDPAAERCARLLHRFQVHVFERLRTHPVNVRRHARGLAMINSVITHRAGRALNLETLEQRWGLRVLTLCSAPVYAGVFMAMGGQAELVKEKPCPGDDLSNKLERAFERLKDFDLIHVHSKAPDDAAHTKDPFKKVEVLSALDRGILPVLERVRDHGRLLVVVTGDHSTPSSGEMIHSGEPSPLTIAGPNVWRDAVQGFDEIQCARGALGILLGKDLLNTILSLVDRGKLWGLRDSRFDVPFFPGPRIPFSFDGRGQYDTRGARSCQAPGGTGPTGRRNHGNRKGFKGL
jgi:2,3-bisphosphoglycerate-independent phosphoglycerate mutase